MERRSPTRFEHYRSVTGYCTDAWRRVRGDDAVQATCAGVAELRPFRGRSGVRSWLIASPRTCASTCSRRSAAPVDGSVVAEAVQTALCPSFRRSMYPADPRRSRLVAADDPSSTPLPASRSPPFIAPSSPPAPPRAVLIRASSHGLKPMRSPSSSDNRRVGQRAATGRSTSRPLTERPTHSIRWTRRTASCSTAMSMRSSGTTWSR